MSDKPLLQNNPSVIDKPEVIHKLTKRESNVSHELYHQLKVANPKIELLTNYKVNGVHLDIVVVEDKKISFGLEVKRIGKEKLKDPVEHKKNRTTKTYKYSKIQECGIPVLYCVGKQEIETTVVEVNKRLNTNDVNKFKEAGDILIEKTKLN
jgi:hypothetical protein